MCFLDDIIQIHSMLSTKNVLLRSNYGRERVNTITVISFDAKLILLW